jgi:AcrR family transcriptional regulator
MTEVASKREQAREERRRQILEAALAVFSRKGFHAANVSDVAAEAGVSQGTIYWYFESKEELLNAALLAFFVDFGEESFRAVEGCETAEEKLRCLGRSMEGLSETAEGLFTLFLSYWSSSDKRDEVAQMWAELLAEYKDLVVGIIEEGVLSGEFRPLDADALVWAILGAYDGLAAYGLLMPDMDLSRINDVFMGTVISGLKAGTSVS